MKVDKPKPKRLSDEAYAYIVQEIMPEETMISLPVPVRRGSKLAAAFFGAFAVPVENFTNSEVYKPRVFIYVDWHEEKVLNHEMAKNVKPFEEDQPVGLLLTPEFARERTESLSAMYELLLLSFYTLLEKVAPLYYRGGELSQSERELVAKCLDGYRRIITPEIWGFYEELNPDFFQWLEEQSRTAKSCSKCGASRAPGKKFCTECGAPIGG